MSKARSRSSTPEGGFFDFRELEALEEDREQAKEEEEPTRCLQQERPNGSSQHDQNHKKSVVEDDVRKAADNLCMDVEPQQQKQQEQQQQQQQHKQQHPEQQQQEQQRHEHLRHLQTEGQPAQQVGCESALPSTTASVKTTADVATTSWTPTATPAASLPATSAASETSRPGARAAVTSTSTPLLLSSIPLPSAAFVDTKTEANPTNATEANSAEEDNQQDTERKQEDDEEEGKKDKETLTGGGPCLPSESQPLPEGPLVLVCEETAWNARREDLFFVDLNHDKECRRCFLHIQLGDEAMSGDRLRFKFRIVAANRSSLALVPSRRHRPASSSAHKLTAGEWTDVEVSNLTKCWGPPPPPLLISCKAPSSNKTTNGGALPGLQQQRPLLLELVLELPRPSSSSSSGGRLRYQLLDPSASRVSEHNGAVPAVIPSPKFQRVRLDSGSQNIRTIGSLQARPLGSRVAVDGHQQCRGPLKLLCDANGFSTGPNRAHHAFQAMWSFDGGYDKSCRATIIVVRGRSVRHHFCLQVGNIVTSSAKESLPWEAAFASLSFQLAAAAACNGEGAEEEVVEDKEEFRIVPTSTSEKDWAKEAILAPHRVTIGRVVTKQDLLRDLGSLKDRKFYVAEPTGMAVVLTVELTLPSFEEAELSELSAKLSYTQVPWKHRNRFSSWTALEDEVRAKKYEVLKALCLRSPDPLQEYERVLAERCPDWWCEWLAESRGSKRDLLGKQQRRKRSTQAEAAEAAFEVDEAVHHISSMIADISRHGRELEEARCQSSVKFGFAETLPYMPTQAVRVLSKAVHNVTKKAKSRSWFSFLGRFRGAMSEERVRRAMQRLQTLVEDGDETAQNSRKRALEAVSDRSKTTHEPSVGDRVRIRWSVGSRFAAALGYLNGHIGVLVSFDRSSRLWHLALETFDGQIDLSKENFEAAPKSVGDSFVPTANESDEEETRCGMCSARFLPQQMRQLECRDCHSFCQPCLRKWLRSQLVARCWKCLDLAGQLVSGGTHNSGKPWLAAIKSEEEASSIYRISKSDIDKLDCVCAYEISAGARCVILGHRGLIGQRCLVGRYERGELGGLAMVYLDDGRQLELPSQCLEVDDCQSSGRAARGEACPSKGERLNLGLSVVSLGCACPVKQTMDELFVEQLAMPFDWLVSRLEGVLYFFRHAFRDFTHYDDVKQVGEHGFVSYRSVYQAFPHHNISTIASREAFDRRAQRLWQLVRGGALESTSRPILLVRICAQTSELAACEELYALLRLLGGQKVFLLVIISEQPGELEGPVFHLRHPKLLIYVAGVGGSGFASALRFGMDCADAATTFGAIPGGPGSAAERTSPCTTMAAKLSKRAASLMAATRKLSPLSPASSCAELVPKLKSHARWLSRDSKGEPPTSDIDGCFDRGVSGFFPGRFHVNGKFEASPRTSIALFLAARSGDLAKLSELCGAAEAEGIFVNSWDALGETALFAAARARHAGAVAILLLLGADPNCRNCRGLRPEDVLVSTTGKDARVDAAAENVKVLLKFAGGVESVEEAPLLQALDAVPEPYRRALVSRLGIPTAPDVRESSVPALRAGRSLEALYSEDTMKDAESRGKEEVSALLRLRRACCLSLERRRQELRLLLRAWHPDKHQGKGVTQSRANEVFCYIQAFKPVLFPSESKSRT